MNLTQKIIQKLDEKTFTDFEFFSDEKVLKKAPEVLEILLEKEKNDYKKLINKPNEETIFDDYEEYSLLDYFWSILNHLENTNSSEILRKIIENFMPKLQDFANYCAYDKKYFEKIVYSRKNLKLDSDQKRILDISIKNYKDRGINLSDEKQQEIKKINKKLSKLSQKFTNNIVDDKALFTYEITNFKVIKDLPKDVLEKAKFSLKGEGVEQNFETNKVEKYVFDADPTSIQAIMKYCSDSQIRKDFEDFSNSVASKGNFDNRKIVLEILNLRDKKAKILGYKNYSELSLNSKMADCPEQVFELILGISKKAKKKAKKELEELKKYFNLEKLETYDLAYYSRILKEEKYEIDDEKLREYFELENVLDYMFSFVEKFYNIKIKKSEIKDKFLEKNNIRVYEIWRNGELISYYFADLFYRKEKGPGAWCGQLREKFIGRNSKLPIIINVCNFAKNNSGKTLLYLRDAETIFHEFGHAIHKFLSESKYSSLNGGYVERDFVELPSQLMENWVSEKSSLKKLAKHYKTGEQISDEIIDKLEKLKYFMSGNFVARQNEFTLVDMSLHTKKIPENLRELDKKVLEYVNKFSFYKREKNYKMYSGFSHIFDGGYASGYYSYMRAEIFEADLFEEIKLRGMFSPQVGEKLLKTIIGQGTRKKASELFFDFMGRKVDNKAFLERYGI